MKYLDRSDLKEIGLIALVVIAALLLVSVFVIAIYYAYHPNLSGCTPHVTL